MNVSSRTRLRGGFRYFKGHFRTRWCLRCVFCSVMHHCVVRRSGSVPFEITEPTLEARSSRHVFIETLQSKDFLAILLICGNFQITAFRVHSSLEAKNHIENRATSETVWAQFIFCCAKFELYTKKAIITIMAFLIFCKNTKLLFLDSQHKIFSGLTRKADCIISSKIQLHHVFLQ